MNTAALVALRKRDGSAYHIFIKASNMKKKKYYKTAQYAVWFLPNKLLSLLSDIHAAVIILPKERTFRAN